MMKRNDGYALSYVLVVLLVLAAIAIATMSLSLNTLQRQRASIDRMQDKYAAQGMVEQVVALFEKSTMNIAEGETVSILGENGEEIPLTAHQLIEAMVTPHNTENADYSINIEKVEDDNLILMDVAAMYNSAQVTTQLKLKPIEKVIKEESPADGETPPANNEGNENGDNTENGEDGTTEPPKTEIVGYEVTYISYATTAYVDEGGAAE